MNVPFIARLNANPIVRAEMLHRQRGNTRLTRRLRWILWGVYVVGLGIGMIYFGGELVGAATGRSFVPLYHNPTLPTLTDLMVVFTQFAYIFLMIGTLYVASGPLILEKQRPTWVCCYW